MCHKQVWQLILKPEGLHKDLYDYNIGELNLGCKHLCHEFVLTIICNRADYLSWSK